MRAPAEVQPRPLADIADDIAKLLKAPASQVERQLRGYKDPASGHTVLGIKQMTEGPADLPTLMTPIRKDFARERDRLQRLARKYRKLPFVAHFLDGAIKCLAVVEGMRRPDPHVQPVKLLCAVIAKDMIKNSPDKRLGSRLRNVASLLYEAATDIPGQNLERACREVTKGMYERRYQIGT
jgi:hypothetical protein